jgi:hypothetical protein
MDRMDRMDRMKGLDGTGWDRMDWIDGSTEDGGMDEGRHRNPIWGINMDDFDQFRINLNYICIFVILATT